jgi:hypothetical protein
MKHRTLNRMSKRIQLCVVILAFLVRLAILPHRDETRGFDEEGYLTGSLALIEGLPPGYKAAPAGPNTWVGWLYTGVCIVWHSLSPTPAERALPIQVRPFIATNSVLFDHYRDLSGLHNLWIWTQLLLTLYAIFAAFRLGYVRAGLAGGVLISGLLALVPLFVEFSMMSRPYMTAWAFAILSLDSAVSRKNSRRIMLAALFLGLAIASRVEMVLFAPIVFWEFWYRAEEDRLTKVLIRFAVVTVATTCLAAPWLLTHLLGNLRTIATVRLEGSSLDGATTLWGVLRDLGWSQGLLASMVGVVAVVGCLLIPNLFIDHAGRSERGKIAVQAVYVAALFASLLHGKVLLHQQGAIVLSLMTFSLFSVKLLNRISRAAASWIVLLVLLLPFIHTLEMVRDSQRNYAPDGSISWVENHVPPGTIVYLQPGMQNLLPTSASASALWTEVSDDNAWRKKFESGLERFGIKADETPRALSDENLVQERGNRRGLFILGSRPGYDAPRYDIRLYNSSPVFGVHDIATEFARTGGVVISQRGTGLSELATPTASWVNRDGVGSFVYCSPDVKMRLKR